MPKNNEDQLLIRPIVLPDDLEAMARMYNLTSLEPVSPQQIGEWWRKSEGEIRHTELAVAGDGFALAMLDLGRDAWMAAGFYVMNLVVDPAWRRQGIGALLLERGLALARQQEAHWVEVKVRDNDPISIAFAQKRGFAITRHTFASLLDLAAFDERPFLADLQRAEADGLRFFSLADLGELTEASQRKLYELNRTTGLDNPGNTGEFAPFEEFQRWVFKASWFRPEGQILAADGERWVGLAAVSFYPNEGYAYNAFTGVAAEYRGRGLATALKLLAARFARQCGAAYMRTDNDSQNAPMLAVNRKLGYQPQPGRYRMTVEL
jgi:GNAT superfamily N-acetyltransferase